MNPHQIIDQVQTANQVQQNIFNDFTTDLYNCKDFTILYEDYNTRPYDDSYKNTHDAFEYDLNLILLYEWYAKNNSDEIYYLGSSYCDYLCNNGDFLVLEDITQTNDDKIKSLVDIFDQSKKLNLNHDNSLYLHMYDTTNIISKNELNKKYTNIGYPFK